MNLSTQTNKNGRIFIFRFCLKYQKSRVSKNAIAVSGGLFQDLDFFGNMKTQIFVFNLSNQTFKEGSSIQKDFLPQLCSRGGPSQFSSPHNETKNRNRSHGIYHTHIPKNRFASKETNHMTYNPKGWQNQDIDFWMTKKPEQMLI